MNKMYIIYNIVPSEREKDERKRLRKGKRQLHSKEKQTNKDWLTEGEEEREKGICVKVPANLVMPCIS